MTENVVATISAAQTKPDSSPAMWVAFDGAIHGREQL